MPEPRIVTLTTDFGLNDHFIGTMRGVILNINPTVQVADICNAVQSFDVLDGALTIAQAYRYFPSDTVHLVVVDPGVGTARRPIIATTEKHIFVAPDNGVLSLVYEREERLSVRHITSEHYFLQPVSRTFHGRDIFSPVAGWLSKGVEPAKFGDEITDFVRFAMPKPKVLSPTTLKGVVLKMDKFGNLITNITPLDAPALFEPTPPEFTLTVGKAEIKSIREAYGLAAPGEVFGILGSTGFLELSANRAYAAQIVQANRGAEVQLIFAQPQFSATPAAQ